MLSQILLAGMWLGIAAGPDPLTLPQAQRPEWLVRDGIVMAGSWEPLLFRVRRDGSPGYDPSPEQRAAYLREQSPEMIDQLKELGVNFVMTHCYKAFGLNAERESMEDAARFSKLCHEAGLRVGVYNNSGTIGWELAYKERPDAERWLVLRPNGQPISYGRAAYRYYWNRNHPEAQAFHHEIARFAVKNIETDLLHFDNYNVGPEWDETSIRRFRAYLAETFNPQQRAAGGIGELASVRPPQSPKDGLLWRAWQDFTCQSLADSYHQIGAFARTLRKDVLLELNPGGPGLRIQPPVDHGRMLTGGEAFWDEGEHPGFENGRLRTRIRTYKIARRMDNVAFAYTTNPLEAAESMAFNLDCLGCICWFEYAKLVKMPGSEEPVSPTLAPYVKFFHHRRDLLRDTKVRADVAVLRSFPSQVYADPAHAQLTARVEEKFIAERIPFQIIYDRHLSELSRYQVLVLAGVVALSDPQAELIRRFAAGGGKVCVVGETGTHDEWLIPRPKAALSDAPDGSVTRINESDVVTGVRKAATLSLRVQGPVGLCAELTEQPGRLLVHLVNYRADGPVRNVKVAVRVPTDKRVSATMAGPTLEGEPELGINRDSAWAEFTVPEVDVYLIAVVRLGEKG